VEGILGGPCSAKPKSAANAPNHVPVSAYYVHEFLFVIFHIAYPVYFALLDATKNPNITSQKKIVMAATQNEHKIVGAAFTIN
jgi:hypothetical protein